MIVVTPSKGNIPRPNPSALVHAARPGEGSPLSPFIGESQVPEN
jgi:hypothetical protein